MTNSIDLTGQRFGKLIVTKRKGVAKSGHALWLCKCDCGNERIITSNRLHLGTMSCGCLQKERSSIVNKYVNRKGRKKREPIRLANKRLVQCYRDMRSRCENSNNKRYRIYGGRGITVCDEWRSSFAKFKEWAELNGYRDNLTLDRINVNGNYEPENCRWVDSKIQNNNRTNNRIVEYKNEIMTLHELSEKYNIAYKTLWKRLNMGWSLDDAINKPIRSSCRWQ